MTDEANNLPDTHYNTGFGKKWECVNCKGLAADGTWIFPAMLGVIFLVCAFRLYRRKRK
jgi:hypothetical protein